MSDWTDSFGPGGCGVIPPWELSNCAVVNNVVDPTSLLSQMQGVMQAQVQANAVVQVPTAVPAPRFGHSESLLKDATKVQEFFYPEPMNSTGRAFLPQYRVASFSVGVGVRVVGTVQFPGEFYATRGEAQAACADRIREALVAISERLVEELTTASMGQGLNGDAELDVTDALRRYIKAVKT